MSATQQRDRVCSLAKSKPAEATAIAREIKQPWFRAQAFSWVVRFTDGNPVMAAREAAKAAKEGDDPYKQSAVRAWEIAALAERQYISEARKSLSDALAFIPNVHPLSSRSEALILLLQAAFRIHRDDAVQVNALLISNCPSDAHWRCKRAQRDAEAILSGDIQPRPFFW